MILAAGEGRRLQPLTHGRAKPTLAVLGTPLIVHAARLLRSAGIREIVINLHRHGRSVVDALERETSSPGNGDLAGISFSFSRERVLLGTGGGVGKVRDWLAAGGTAVVANSDFLSDLDLAAAVEWHRAGDALGTLVGTRPVGSFRGSLSTDPSSRLLGIGTPPPEPGCGPADPDGGTSRLEFAGVHILEPELLTLFPDEPCDSVRDVYVKKVLGGAPGARGSGRSGLAVFRHEGWWWEFGGLGPFLRGQLDLVRTRRLIEGGTLVERGGGAIWLAPGADLSAGAHARGVSVLGQSARVREGAEIEDTVVLGHALIPSRCRLTRCIVAEGTVLTGGGRFEDAAISSSPCAAPAALASAAETGGGRIPPPEGCKAEADLWVRSIPSEAARPLERAGARPEAG